MYGVEDTPPDGWLVSGISHEGQFDSGNNAVKWFFIDDVGRMLSYSALPDSGSIGRQCFAGTVNFDGSISQNTASACWYPCNASEHELAGDPVAGAQLLADSCAVCHGVEGSGGSSPNILGTSASDLAVKLAAGSHAGVPFPGLTDQDLADLAAFLAAEVKTTVTGLQYYDFEVGTGASPKCAISTVHVAYTGYLSNGTIFDSNENAIFQLSTLIPGFSEGVQGMKVGGRRRLIIPPDLGYGPGGNAGAGIESGDTIVFDVALLFVEESLAGVDCNANGVPDECESSPVRVVHAGTLGSGVIVGGEFSGTLQGSICPTGLPISRVLWTMDSLPPGSEIFIASPSALTTPFTIQPATPGDHLFRLTWVDQGIFDTVTLTLKSQ